jgi:hypothetical protein
MSTVLPMGGAGGQLAVVDADPQAPVGALAALVEAQVRRGCAVVLDAGAAGDAPDLLDVLRVAEMTVLVTRIGVDRIPDIAAVAVSIGRGREGLAGVVTWSVPDVREYGRIRDRGGRKLVLSRAPGA